MSVVPPIINTTSTESNVSSLTDYVTNWLDDKVMNTGNSRLTELIQEIDVITHKNISGETGTKSVVPIEDNSVGLWGKETLNMRVPSMKNISQGYEDISENDVLNIDFSGTWEDTNDLSNPIKILEPTCITNSVATTVVANKGDVERNEIVVDLTVENGKINNNNNVLNDKIPTGVMGINKVSGRWHYTTNCFILIIHCPFRMCWKKLIQQRNGGKGRW